MTLLPRAKRCHYLSLLLCAFLAWPANLPIGAEDVARAELDLDAFSHPAGLAGHTLHRSDRKTPQHPADWSVDADNAEGSDGRDDLRYIPLAIPHHRLDLPSLVPMPLESRPPAPVDSLATFPGFTPLRC